MKRLALALCALAFVALGVMLERRVTALERRALDWDRHFGYKSRYPFCGEWHKPYHTKGEIDESWYVPYPVEEHWATNPQPSARVDKEPHECAARIAEVIH